MERAPQGMFQNELEWCILQMKGNLCLNPTPKQVSEMNPGAGGTSSEAVPGVSGAEQIQTSVRATEQENWNGALSLAASGQEPKSATPDKECSLAPLVPADQPAQHAAEPEALGSSLPTESPGKLQISALQKPELTQTAGSAPKEEDRSHVTEKVPLPETAPEDETVPEKSTLSGAAQKKKKKKKQKIPVSKKETEETEVSKKTKEGDNGCQNKDSSHQDETSQQSEDQLWNEVDWCVKQLELGLRTQKATPRQAEEALRAIRTLRSEKAPLVKKRQLMRAMFGDYRKKMEEERLKEEKLTEIALKSARIVEVKGSVCRKSSHFIRKSLAACRKSQGSTDSASESPRTLNTGLFKFTPSQEDFRFNFF